MGKQASKSRAKRPTAAERLPDVLGSGGRVEVLARLLAQIAQQRFQVEATQIAHGHGADDLVSGYPPTREDGTTNSYKHVLADLNEQERRLADKYPDVIDRVRELVRKREEAQT